MTGPGIVLVALATVLNAYVALRHLARIEALERRLEEFPGDTDAAGLNQKQKRPGDQAGAN